MFTRMVIPITLVALAGCSRQQSTTNNAQPPVQAVNTQPATPPGPSPADRRESDRTVIVREPSHVVPVSTIAAAPAASARNYPVVSAEIADTRPPVLRRPSAFAPREKPQIVHTVKTSTQTQESTVAIPAGTRIRVRLAQTLDT